MSISGGFKFFGRNKAYSREGARAISSNNQDLIDFAIDKSKYTRWESVNSDDTETVTIEIQLPRPTEINRIFLINHNLKMYRIRHAIGEFTNVRSLDRPELSISEDDYLNNVSYYEFDNIVTSLIEIQAIKTIEANKDKFIESIIATKEIGTFGGFPKVSNFNHSKNEKVGKVLSGKGVVQKGSETTSLAIQLRTHSIQKDIEIVENLHDSNDSFLVWPCGGRYGKEHFRIPQKGWRLEDIYNMQTVRPLKTEYASGVYVNGVNTGLQLIEVV